MGTFDTPGAGWDSAAANASDRPESALEQGTPGDARSWAEITAVPPRRRSPRVGAFGLIAIVGVLAIVAASTALLLVLRSEQGQVMFTTTDPNGGNSCVVIDRVSTVEAGRHVWMVVMFMEPMDDKPLTVDIYHDGALVWSYTWPVDVSKGRYCTWGDDMAGYPVGTWTYTFTHDGKIEASGTLTIR